MRGDYQIEKSLSLLGRIDLSSKSITSSSHGLDFPKLLVGSSLESGSDAIGNLSFTIVCETGSHLRLTQAYNKPGPELKVI